MKMRIARSLVALAVTGFLGAIHGPIAWADPVQDAIKAAEDRWAKLYNAKDARGLSMLYTRDALRLPPDASRVQGREALQAMFKKEFDDGLKNIKFQSTEIRNDAKMAYVVGNFSLDVPDQQGNITTATGNYVVIYVKESDGVWRLTIDTWNDAPAK